MVDTTGERRGVVRDLLADGGLVALAALAGFGPAVYWYGTAPAQPVGLPHLDYLAGALGCLALWWRRRFPLALAAALVLMSAFSLAAGAASLVALLTVAVHRSAKATAVVAAGNVLSIMAFLLLRPGPFPFSWMLVALQTAVVVGLAGWGCSCAAGGSSSRRCANGPPRPRSRPCCAPNAPSRRHARPSHGRCTTSSVTGCRCSACTRAR